MNLKSKSSQIKGTITNDYVKHVFPHRRSLTKFVEGMQKWGFSTPDQFKISVIGVGVAIHIDILDEDLRKCINFYRGIKI